MGKIIDIKSKKVAPTKDSEHSAKKSARQVLGLLTAAALAVTFGSLAGGEKPEAFGSAPMAEVTFGPGEVNIEEGKGGDSVDRLIRAQAQLAEANAEAAHPGVDVPEITDKTILNLRSNMRQLNEDSITLNGSVYSVQAGDVADVPKMDVSAQGLYNFALTEQQQEQRKD